MSETKELKLKKHDNVETNTEMFDIDNYLNSNWDKIDENVEETNNQILQLETEKAELEAELKEAQEDVYQASIRGQASGEYIHVEDSSGARCKIGISGNSEQETRSGKNLVRNEDKNVGDDSYWYLYSTYNKETYTMTRSTTTNDESFIAYRIGSGIIKNNTQYTISFEAKKNDYVKSFEVLFAGYKSTGVKGKTIGLTNEFQKYSYTFTTDATADYKTFSLIRFDNNGSTENGKEAILTVRNVMLVEGTDTDFEQHGASPSPDYPSEIKTVGSSVKVTKCNKNILNIEDIDEKEKGGIKYSVKNGVLKLNGTATAGFDIQLANNVKIKKGKYTHSCDYIQSGLYISFDNLGTTMLSATTGKERTIELTLDKIYSKYFIWIDKGTVLNNVEIKLQLEVGEVGNETTAFEQYQGQSYIMPVQQEMLEEDYFDFDNEEEVHRWNKIVLTGNEYWQYDSDFKYFRSPNFVFNGIPAESQKNLGEQKSNYFEITSDWLGFRNEINKNIMYGVSNIGYRICIRNINCTTEEQFKTWLKSQYDAGTPVIIYYKLQTPTRLKFTEEQKAVAKELNNARTYKNITNITTDSIAVLDLDYAKDLETLLNNIQALAVSNASEEV